MHFTIAQAPPEILAALREIDAKADLVCVGDGFWWLGVREPNPAAIDALAREVKGDEHGAIRLQADREEAGFRLTNPTAGTRFAMLQVMAAGFKPIQLYQCERPGYEIVQDFRLRDYNWRVRPDEAVQEMYDEHIDMDAANRRRTAILREYAEQESWSLFNHVMQKAKRFLQRAAFPGAHA